MKRVHHEGKNLSGQSGGQTDLQTARTGKEERRQGQGTKGNGRRKQKEAHSLGSDSFRAHISESSRGMKAY